MDGLLIYDKVRGEKNKQFILMLQEESKKQGIKLHLVFAEDIVYGVKESLFFAIKNSTINIKNCSFAIVRTIEPLLSKHLELMNIRVFNNSFVSEICNNKLATYQYLASKQIKVCQSEFYSASCKLNAVFGGTPTIIKTAAGHGGSEVFFATNQNEFDNAIFKTNNNPIVIQPYIGDSPKDLRVYVVGNKIISSVLRTGKKGSFKANFSQGGSVCEYSLTRNQQQKVEQIISLFDLDFVGIDFLFEDDQLVLNEIEDIVGSRMLYSVSQINIARIFVEHITNVLNN